MLRVLLAGIITAAFTGISAAQSPTTNVVRTLDARRWHDRTNYD